MRIALLSQAVDDKTGIGRIVSSLAKQFWESGNEVHCLAQRIEITAQPFHVREVFGIPGSKALSKLAFRFSAGKIVPRLNCDIIHAFGVGAFANVVSAQSCHRAGLDVLNEHKDAHLAKGGLGLYNRISLADEQRLLKSLHTKRIIAVSHLVKSQIMESYGVDHERISVVPNGVDVSRFDAVRQKTDRNEVRRVLGLSQEHFVLLFVGNEFGRKGLDALVRSLGVIRNESLRLLVVGADDPTPYKKVAKSLGCLDQIKFTGQVSAPERLFLAADTLVLPTLYEPFGVVVVEAMAAGLPVITTRFCGAVETMIHGEHGLYLQNPRDIDDLSRQILRVVSDEELRARLAANGKQEAKKYDWMPIALRILRIYHEIVASR
jgi:UDP-glucose:(heptosyl)LPS alpha-1,3-glucosyltransferase